MKRVIIAFVIFQLLAGTVSADVGIGIKWFTESEPVNEGEQKCLVYGLYNPFDTDVKGFLEATRDLTSIYQAEEPKLVPANTSSKEALPAQICFSIPKVYKEDSFYGFLPQRQCGVEDVMLKGEVVAAYKLSDGAGLGSATGASFAAPLKLQVRCDPVDRNWIPVYAIIILMVAGILGLVYTKKKRSS